MLKAIILAGGMSKRMGVNKIMMPFRGKKMIDYVLETYGSLCDEVIVVTGHYHGEIALYLEKYQDVKVKYNDKYRNGMFTSVLKGVGNEETDILLTPGDIPLVKLETLQKIIEGTGDIIVPSYDHQLGHPIFISKNALNELKEQNKYSSLKEFRNDYGYTIINTKDQGVIMDFDTIEMINNSKGRESNGS